MSKKRTRGRLDHRARPAGGRARSDATALWKSCGFGWTWRNVLATLDAVDTMGANRCSRSVRLARVPRGSSGKILEYKGGGIIPEACQGRIGFMCRARIRADEAPSVLPGPRRVAHVGRTPRVADGADDNSSCDERSCIALRELPEATRFDPGQFELCGVNPIGILSIVV